MEIIVRGVNEHSTKTMAESISDLVEKVKKGAGIASLMNLIAPPEIQKEFEKSKKEILSTSKPEPHPGYHCKKNKEDVGKINIEFDAAFFRLVEASSVEDRVKATDEILDLASNLVNEN